MRAWPKRTAVPKLRRPRLAVRGVGLWSAQMFLLHQLHRPDVLPAGDIGIRRAVQANS